MFSQTNPQEAALQIVIIGDTGVGKTSLSQTIRGDKFPMRHDPTVGASKFTNDKYQSDQDSAATNKKLKLTYSDTGGHKRYRALLPMYLRNPDLVMIVYDVSSRESFNDVDDFIAALKSRVGSTCRIGCK